MARPWYVIVFNQDRTLGEDPDPKQHWHKGQVFSSGSVIDATDLARKPWLTVITLDRRPNDADTWDPVNLRYVDLRDVPETATAVSAALKD